MQITNRMLYLYLSALPGNKLVITPQGTVDVRPKWSPEAHYPDGTAFIACPGLDQGFIDTLTDGFAHANDRGVFTELKTQKVLGHIFDVLAYRIERGDMEPFRHQVAQLLALQHGYRCAMKTLRPEHRWGPKRHYPALTHTVMDSISTRETTSVRTQWSTSATP